MRRKNAVVVMATQQISDIANSDIADVVLENCPTKILLPNAESKNPGSRSFYERIGLNERELDILQVSVPKQHYYVVSKLGRRLVDLGVGKVALAWVGVNGREERQIAEAVMEQFGDGWRAEWLRLRSLEKWAEYLRSLEKRGRKETHMRKFVISVLILLGVSGGAPQKAEAGAFATEVTQLLNHAQLVLMYIREGLQLENELAMYANMLRNTKNLSPQTFGQIAG